MQKKATARSNRNRIALFCEKQISYIKGVNKSEWNVRYAYEFCFCNIKALDTNFMQNNYSANSRQRTKRKPAPQRKANLK